MLRWLNRLQEGLAMGRRVDWLAPVALRAYLVPVFWVAGTNKLHDFDSVVAWFGNPDWGLGLPAPLLMAALAVGAEVIGAILLAAGLATRWACIPLMITMLVAAVSVHWDNGWQAVADPLSPHAGADVGEAMLRLERARDILREHGNYEWLTGQGNFVVSNNGMEWAVTYLVMLLALFTLGGGRYLSADYWIARRFRR